MANISWINTAGGSWTTASNWDTNTVPGSGDNAFISAGGSYSVNLFSGAASVDSLAMTSGKTLAIMSATFVLGAGASTTINNAGSLSVSNVGHLKLVGEVTLQGGGSVLFDFFQTMAVSDITSNGSTAKLINVDHGIGGTGKLGDPNLTIVNGTHGAISGGTFGKLIVDTGSNTITNAGTIGGFGTTVQILSPLDNSGTVMATSGTLTGAAVSISGDVNNTGVISTTAGTVTLSGNLINQGTLQANGDVILLHGIIPLNAVGLISVAGLVANLGVIRADTLGSIDIGSITGNGAVIINGGTLHLGSTYDGAITFTGPGGVFKGSPGNHNLVGDGQGNTLDDSAATIGVQFDLSTGYAYSNFGGPTVGVDHFFNISVFKGGSGNDTFIGGPGNHTFAGDGGSADTLDYSAATSPVQFNFTTNATITSFGGSPGTDQFSSIEIFKGGSGDDTFIGGPGNHTIDGGAGTDTLDYSAATTAVQFNFSTDQATNNFAGPPAFFVPGVDTFSNLELFKGGSGNDTFVGGPGNHTIDGGGGGSNMLDYSAATSGVEFDLVNGLAYNNFGGPAVTVDHFFNVQSFRGGSGNDTFIGGPGNDTFEGGPGADMLNGGGGINALSYEHSSAAVLINLGNGLAMGGDAQGDSISNFQGVIGSSFNDAIFGSGLNDVIEGKGGADYLDGSGGVNTLVYATSPAGVLINLGNGQALGGDAEGDTFVNFTNVVGSDHDDALFGDGNANTLTGLGGNDYLYGNGGNDIFLFMRDTAGLITFGQDTIGDFTIGQDQIAIDKTIFADFAGLQSHMTQNGANTVITVAAGIDTITLQNVQLANLHASDFLFV